MNFVHSISRLGCNSMTIIVVGMGYPMSIHFIQSDVDDDEERIMMMMMLGNI